MKLYFDPKECTKQGLSYDTAFYLASLYCEKEITERTIDDALNKGFVKKDDFKIRLTQDGVDVIESVFLNSEFQKEDERFEKLAEKMQDIFPQGKKFGTSYMWKDSRAIIIKKLKTLMKKYNVSFTDEQVLKATKKYVESFNGDYQYMQILRYFICKKDINTGEETSQLLSYIENDGQEETSDNWQNSVR